MAYVLKRPSTEVIKTPTGSADLWEIWEWDNTEDNEALSYINPKYLTFEDLPLAVENEIRRIHREIGEYTIPYEQFDRGDYNSTSKNVVYNLPSNRKNLPDSFKLMRMSNNDIVFGLTAWRKDKNPEYLDDC